MTASSIIDVSLLSGLVYLVWAGVEAIATLIALAGPTLPLLACLAAAGGVWAI